MTVAVSTAGFALPSPTAAPGVISPAITSRVALAAFENPFTSMVGTAELAANYLINNVYGTAEENWPFSGIAGEAGAELNQGITLVPPHCLNPDGSCPGYLAPGILPQFVGDPLPIARQLLDNWFGYAQVGIAALADALVDVGDIIWSIPATAVSVVRDLLSLDFEQAVTDITNAIGAAVVSAHNAVAGLIEAGKYVVSNIVAKAHAVIHTLTGLVHPWIGASKARVRTMVDGVTAFAHDFVAALGARDPETIWNTAVEGLLSPAGLPGLALNLTAGAGVLRGTDPEPVIGDYVPSLRTSVQSIMQSTRYALTTVPKSEFQAAAAVQRAPRAPRTPSPSYSAPTPATSPSSTVKTPTQTKSTSPGAASRRASTARQGRVASDRG